MKAMKEKGTRGLLLFMYHRYAFLHNFLDSLQCTIAYEQGVEAYFL